MAEIGLVFYPNVVPYTQPIRGSFWWRDVSRLTDIYRTITRCTIGDGTTLTFWKDFWLHDTTLADSFPRLFSYAVDQDISVADAANEEGLLALFSLPISDQAFEEL